MFDDALVRQAETLLAQCRATGLRLATAESCTGGLIGGLLTEIAGSSDVFDRGFITYSNRAKMEVLDVASDTLRDHGAVSAETASAMAQGALAQSSANLAVAVTGVAGPGGGSAEKPVGLVWFATALRDAPTISDEQRFGDIGRSEVRKATIAHAIALLGGRL